MKTPLRAAALAVSLGFAGAASAQQPAPSRGETHVGIGVGLPTSELATLLSSVGGGATPGVLPAQIYVPIDVGRSFRIEPQVGVFSLKQNGGGELSYYSAGAGAFWLAPVAERAHLYLGGRLAVEWFRAESSGGPGVLTTTKGTDVYLAAAFGGEVKPHPRLGIGAEAQVGRWWIGDRSQTTSGSTTVEPGGSSWQTQGILFVRVYFI